MIKHNVQSHSIKKRSEYNKNFIKIQENLAVHQNLFTSKSGISSKTIRSVNKNKPSCPPLTKNGYERHMRAILRYSFNGSYPFFISSYTYYIEIILNVLFNPIRREGVKVCEI